MKEFMSKNHKWLITIFCFFPLTCGWVLRFLDIYFIKQPELVQPYEGTLFVISFVMLIASVLFLLMSKSIDKHDKNLNISPVILRVLNKLSDEMLHSQLLILLAQIEKKRKGE